MRKIYGLYIYILATFPTYLLTNLICIFKTIFYSQKTTFFLCLNINCLRAVTTPWKACCPTTTGIIGWFPWFLVFWCRGVAVIWQAFSHYAPPHLHTICFLMSLPCLISNKALPWLPTKCFLSKNSKQSYAAVIISSFVVSTTSKSILFSSK